MSELAQGKHTVTAEWTELSVGRAPVGAIHARPTGPPIGGVVIAPDIWGLRPLFEDLCRRLATRGFAVVAVEPFTKIPKAELEPLDAVGRQELVKSLEDADQLAALAAAAAFLEVSDGVHGAAVIGFCMGGYYALKAAASGRFERAVIFYGMITTPVNWRSIGHASPLDTAGDVVPTLAILGGRDPYTPAEDIEALRNAWKERADCKVVVYPSAEHGFVHDPSRPTHRPDDAADAWHRTLAFLLD